MLILFFLFTASCGSDTLKVLWVYTELIIEIIHQLRCYSKRYLTSATCKKIGLCYFCLQMCVRARVGAHTLIHMHMRTHIRTHTLTHCINTHIPTDSLSTHTLTHCINTHIPTDSLSTHTWQCAYVCAYTYACIKSFDLHLNGQMLPYELHNMLSCNSWLSIWSATSMYKQTKLRRYFKNRTTTDKTKSKATTVEQCKNQNLTPTYS